MAGDRSARQETSHMSSGTPSSTKKSHKRKRDLDGSTVATSTPTPTKKSKKDPSAATDSTPSSDVRKKRKRSTGAADGAVPEESAPKESAVSTLRSEASSPSKDAKDKKKSKHSKRRTSGTAVESAEEPANLDDVKEKSAKDSKKSARAAESTQADDDTKPKDKFAGIRSKFEKSMKARELEKARKKDTDEDDSTGLLTAEPVVAQGLEPLPQPEQVPEVFEKPTYSSLPAWLANPLRTSATEKTKFSELGINANLLRVLEDNGYKEAFAVQSAVIPLLLQGPKNHAGDVCVSAATGSGKTLSYVLPLVTALEQIPAPRLRGLIVVPTRELVKQAREACELCVAGSGLRVGSAVGNVAIKDEQRSLMRIDQVYGPATFQRRQHVKMSGDDWTNFNLQDYITDAVDSSEALPGYVHRPEPNVDILICTPGRLVDHIRYTKGFTLKHLEWLVIDEADRLLNESFQEWVDVVMNSLDARRSPEAFGFSGTFLSELGLPIHSREPRKVVLSATMTRDVTKLNSLRLANPKLVIVGSTDTAAVGDDESGVIAGADEQFTLPPTLKEHSISVGDGSLKPLYLLRLLLSHIRINGTNQAAKASDSDTSDDTSSDDTSSDETSSDESSSDDSDSDSDSDSDTSSSGSDSESDDTSSSESDSSSSESSSDSDSDSDSSSSSASTTSRTKPTRPRPSPSSNTNKTTPTVLIFTKSSESASRLARLLALLDPTLASRTGTIIKSNKSSASRKTLTAYRRGKLAIIIATDRASRGLDLPRLTHVVNYDVPTSVTTYVHRVGRTARAGQAGAAWTLVAHREGKWFAQQIGGAADGQIVRVEADGGDRPQKVHRVAVSLEGMKAARARYAEALDVLEREVRSGGKEKEK
ncbi:P-loop containing nucleoside triphosphate hydrolase protein, partial [Aspergillus violaceofuscus CBS 115571]